MKTKNSRIHRFVPGIYKAQRLGVEKREERDTLLKVITDERITFQYAANAEWPHT
ncbi:MAG: hypothetical protein ACRER2_02535 [Methylococcales bacterium]